MNARSCLNRTGFASSDLVVLESHSRRYPLVLSTQNHPASRHRQM